MLAKSPVLWLVLALVVAPSAAGQPLNDIARALPLYAEGRVMPLETFARQTYSLVTGRDAWGEALPWLLGLLADPESDRRQPRIVVNLPQLLPGLTERRLYSYQELAPRSDTIRGWVQRHGFDPSPEGKEQARLGRALTLYEQLADTFAPGPEALKSPLRLFRRAAGYANPAEVLAEPARDQRTSDNLGLLLLWKTNWTNDGATAGQALALLVQRLSEDGGNGAWLELLHNGPGWVPLLVLFWGLGWLGSLWAPGAWRRRSLPWGLGLAWVVGLTWMALRVVITGRPPVVNLPSTFQFVSVVVLTLAWGVSLRSDQRTWAVVLGGVAVAVAFLQGLFAGGANAFSPLQAVLNTNFWLTVHVPTIVTGYALLLVAGTLGHVGLFREVDRWLSPTLMAGLVTTVAGTLLGGVWADQSWGQFWSWDPKENGALMLVLWTTLVIHQRRVVRPRTANLLAALLIPVLLFSWLGVNLLGQGSHSYGYSPGKGLIFGALLAGDGLVLLVAVLRKRPT